jgi:hypothetical protein
MGVSVVEWLLNFGLGGLIIFLIATGVLVPGFIYKELQRQAEKLSDALAVERQRNSDLQQAASTGVRALDSLAQIAEEQRARRVTEEAAHHSAIPAAPVPSGEAAK